MLITIIEITRNGNDVAVIVDGMLILSADPSAGDDPGAVYQVAERLGTRSDATLQIIKQQPEADWNWDAVCKALSPQLKAICL
ncbi:hypothetical protein GCM10023116_47980 [Kistimonas scapharcae]|uniref:Uncharacterized protein n=1 Tax=Kistimonas scapharcae TaxID=1036133 RepID=A0ABP8VAU9_9GAMM